MPSGYNPSLAKLMLDKTNSEKEEVLLRRIRVRDGDLGLW